MKNLSGDSAAIARRINDELADRRQTKMWLAKAAELSYRTVFDAAKGVGVGDIRRDTAERLASALGVNVQWLLTGREPKQAPAPPVVREERASCATRVDDITLRQAIAAIARHTGRSDEEVAKVVFELMTKRRG